ncbi:MAG TPA: PAS domain S-box protein [Steroidobacteraceae bacterium]|jgi:PAS domain S-box-containing protein|nr:PAS domain S-box protein [Steroidobacteraceae bacterium]
MQSASVELARGALDAAPDAMIIIDEAGIVRFANRQVTALFGYAHDDIVGQSVERLMPSRYRDRHVAHRQGYIAAQRLRPMGQGLALFGQRQDGSEFPVEISLSPIENSQQVLVAAAIRDVTERRRVENELRIAREASEHARRVADQLREVADQHRELADQAREEADRANRAKSRFLAMASHDLRQPLQTLALLNGSLRRMSGNADVAQALSQQEQAISTMSRLLNALLDISKLESGAIKPQPADFKVAVLFEQLRSEFAGIATSKGLELQVQSSEETIHSDASLVQQILNNLVSNAIKYTREGRVQLRSLRQNGSIRIDVVDTGIGIPAEQLAYIYDEFYQVGVPANTSRDGYGLGLSIVRRLVNLLDLRLQVSSRVGKGSTFSLMLPLGGMSSSKAGPQPVPTPVSAASSAKPRVILVEDDPGVRDATRMLLSVEGYRVAAVASLDEAVRNAQEQGAPDLLITDYHLREGELGTQVIAALRKSVGADLRSVLITGDTSAAIRQLCDDPHLRIASKPINAEELLALLAALLAS